MKLQFYFDTHIPKSGAVQLRLRGVDVVRCEEVGLARESDEKHLEYAVANNLTIVTHDDDFLAFAKEWAASGRKHRGIIFVHSRSQGNVGLLVKELFEYYALIESGAGTIEDDIWNTIIYIG